DRHGIRENENRGLKPSPPPGLPTSLPDDADGACARAEIGISVVATTIEQSCITTNSLFLWLVIFVSPFLRFDLSIRPSIEKPFNCEDEEGVSRAFEELQELTGTLLSHSLL